MTGVCQGGAAGVSKQSREIIRQNAKTNSVGSNQTALGAADHSLVQCRRYDNDCRPPVRHTCFQLAERNCKQQWK